MRILKIFDGDYPWDVRVEKVVRSLLRAGHEVRLVCRNRRRLPRRERPRERFEIARLPGVPDLLSFPFFASPLWGWSVWSELRHFRPDRILVRDLPLAPLAVVLGWWFGTPVVADLAEPYPDSMRSLRQFQRISWAGRIVRNPLLADLVEWFVVRCVDHALVVCPEAGHRLVRRGLPPDRWTEVGNTSEIDRFLPLGQSVPELDGLSSRFVLLFSGLLSGDRGLDVALEALSLLNHREPGRFALVVVGEGPVRADLEEKAAQLGLESHVRFTGWISHERLPDLIARAQVGLLPFHSCAHMHMTLANKLFEYASLGLPVIASDMAPMVRVVNEMGSGLVFRAGDAKDLARAIEILAENPETRRLCGEAARVATGRVYNWSADEHRLLEALERPGGAG